MNSDAAGATAAAAAHLVGAARRAIAERNHAHLAFSGGATGTILYRALALESLDWPRVSVWQVDERVAPDGDPLRNATSLRAELLDHVAIPERNVHLMDAAASDLAAAAHAYAEALPQLDVVHLGLGADGHTASWPPGQPEVRTAPSRVTVTQPFNGQRRMTLTASGIAEARLVLWLVCGADKRDALRRVLAGDLALPATHALDERSVLFVDEAAAG